MLHKLEFAGEGGKKFLVDVEAPYSISEALLANITEALLANYRMRFKSQSATADNTPDCVTLSEIETNTKSKIDEH